MPPESEVTRALDNLRELILAPLPGARVRKEKFMQIYRTLRRLQPDHSLDAKPEQPKADPLGGISLDLPFVEEE